MKMLANFNNTMYVTLTPAGKKRLLEYYEAISGNEYDPLKGYADGDQFKFQFWDFIKIFGGGSFSSGCAFVYTTGNFEMELS